MVLSKRGQSINTNCLYNNAHRCSSTLCGELFCNCYKPATSSIISDFDLISPKITSHASLQEHAGKFCKLCFNSNKQDVITDQSYSDSIINFPYSPSATSNLLLAVQAAGVASIVERIGNSTLNALGKFFLNLLGHDGCFTSAFRMADVSLGTVL